MNLSKMMMVCVLALGGLAVGCGDSCKSTCKDEQKCPDVSGTSALLSCDTFCDDLNKVSDAAGCNSQKNKVYDCEDGVKDKCATDASMKCSTETEAFGTCVNTYCQAHPDDADCKKFLNDVTGTTS